jgi:biopolymer transport protein ExbD
MAELTARERRAQRKQRQGAAMDMNLVSLIDVFTILIFFLLSSASGVETLVPPRPVKLPMSMADQAPRETVVLVVSGDEILAEGRRVASVAQALASGDELIAPLKAALDALPKTQHAVTVMADKDIPYRLLRKVMSTCASASYSDVSFAVRRKVDA